MGSKYMCIAESKSGYMLNRIMHEGKKLACKFDRRSSHSIQIQTLYNIHRLFYTALDVVVFLSNNDFRVYGTMMKNRAMVRGNMMLRISSLEKYESLFYNFLDNRMLLTVQKDSKTVFLISNLGNDSLGKAQRNEKVTESRGISYEAKFIDCPNTILKYSETSREVDLLDQMISCYNINLRTKKSINRLSITSFE